ncbi:Exodeoxyribonuclease 7 large subunit [bioreactor metagenome]|uniref:Exodeoxyribonuclease 7 large subunit n=2 Tax=root TaxID=1 RepID=A0A645FQU6_9ZZZZ
MIQREVATVQHLSGKMKYGVRHLIQHQSYILENRAQFVEMVSPENVLRRGYTLTLKNGKIVTSLHDLSVDDTIETRFRDGLTTSVVTRIENSEL